MAESRKNTIQFDDDLIVEDSFEDEDTLQDDTEEQDDIDLEEDMFEDEPVIDMFEEEESDTDEDPNANLADDYGVEADLGDIGVSEDEEEDYETVDVDTDFINPNGDFVVMDNSNPKDNFKLLYIDIQNIAVVTRIRKNKNVEGLRKSILSTGLLEPIVVAPTATDGIYVLLNGYRRILACAKVGIKQIPCIVNTKVNTPEIPILEALYNHSTQYTVKEMVDYIDYLEKEKRILSPSMIEYLLQMDNGDYTKLKDILNDNDDDIVSKMFGGQLTIAQAFKKLEQRRKNESKEEKELKKTEKVYQDSKESGVEQIEGAGETSDGVGLTDEEIASLAISASDLESGLDDKSLEEMVDEGNNIEGFQPHKQTPGEREILDPALSKAVKERDGNMCQCCKEGGMEYIDCNDVHHIQEVYLGGTDAIENLILVCVKCHRLIHLYGRGELHMRPFDQMDEREREKFKRIVRLGMVIRKGLALKGMKREELKKHDKLSTIGRVKPGSGQEAG